MADPAPWQLTYASPTPTPSQLPWEQQYANVPSLPQQVVTPEGQGIQLGGGDETGYQYAKAGKQPPLTPFQQAAGDAIGEAIPGSPGEFAQMIGEMLTGSVQPITGEDVQTAKNVYDVLQGTPLEDVVPQEKSFDQYDESDWGRLVGKIGLQAAQAAPLIAGLRGAPEPEIPSRAEPSVADAIHGLDAQPQAPVPQPQAQVPVAQPEIITPSLGDPFHPPEVPPQDLPYTGGPQTPAPPSAEAPGIANRYVEEAIYRGELPPEAMVTGTGTTAQAAAQEARARLAQDPNAAFEAARRIRNGMARGGDTALLHAYNDQLAEGAAQARQAAIANPSDASLGAAADAAEKSHLDFLQNVKPLAGGLVQRLMVGFQGAYPPDMSTYAGMYKEATNLNEGKPLSPEIRNNLYRRADKVAKAQAAEKAGGDRLQQEIDRSLPRRPVPTKEEMIARTEDFKRRVAPCP